MGRKQEEKMVKQCGVEARYILTLSLICQISYGLTQRSFNSYVTFE